MAPCEPTSALTPSTEMILKLEALIDTAPSAQMRCLAGFFVCLAYGSSRAGDTQDSKSLCLTDDALAGMSFMKNNKAWTKWFCIRRGLSGDWASVWMDQLIKEDLPGPDFVFLAPNTACDTWLQRPATYSDLRRGLHLI